MVQIPPWAEQSFFVQQAVLYSHLLNPVDAVIGLILALVGFWALKTSVVQLNKALSNDYGFRKATAGILMGTEMQADTIEVMVQGMNTAFKLPAVRETMIAMAAATIQDPTMFALLRDGFVHALRDPELTAAIRISFSSFIIFYVCERFRRKIEF